MNAFWKRLVVSALSGGLFAFTSIASDTVAGVVMAMASLLGLLFALRGAAGLPSRALGFVWGMVAYGSALTWFWNIFHASALALFAIIAFFIALFAWMQSIAASRGLTGWSWVVFTTLNWSGLEFIRAELFTLKFPWMTPGLSCGPNMLLPWIGVYGVSALVVAGAAAALRKERLQWSPFLAVIGVIFLAGLSPAKTPDKSKTLSVAAVQIEEDTTARFIQQTEELPVEVRYVVWPEYAVPIDVRSDKYTMAALIELCRKRNITLTFGTQTHHNDTPGWYNTALTLDASGVRGEHYKVHPVHFFNDGTPGKTALPVRTDHGVIGTPICFDCDYEGIVRRMTAAGAEAFVVPTMDASSWSKLEHDQHAALFRIRACENARWMLVGTSSGVSQIIDGNGRVHQQLEALTEGVITGELQRETRLTFYTRWGWLTPWCLLALAAICWIALLLPRRAAKGGAA